MTACLKISSAPGHAARLDPSQSRHRAKKPILPSMPPCRGFGIAGKRLPVAGMVLGYLGLVAILSMAPYWHLSGAPYQSEVLACTDFGGSR